LKATPAQRSVEVKLTALVADLTKITERDILRQMFTPGGQQQPNLMNGAHFDLAVACSFADLMLPSKFAKMMSILAPGALLYLPITFAGGTRFATSPSLSGDGGEEPRGLGRRLRAEQLEVGRAPDEAVIEDIYHHHLVKE
jgi:hypothetical protein